MTAKDGAQLWHSKVFMDAADPILIEDRNGVVVDLNEEAERVYGFSREELIGQPIKTLVPPDRHGQADEVLARCLAGESVRNIEGRRWTRDREIMPVLLTLSALRDESGEINAVATLAKDITERKRAEDASRRMAKVFMDAADPILIENRKGVVVNLNEEAERVYGFSREELIGQPITTLVPPDRHKQADELLARCLAGESVRNIEGRRWTRDREIMPVLLTLSVLRDESGEINAIATLAKEPLLGDSTTVRLMRERIDEAAASSEPVMLVGEPGAGLEAVARAIHERSDLSDRLFVHVNCAVVGRGGESSLFRTGDDIDSMGQFELARGGTLLLQGAHHLGEDLRRRLIQELQTPHERAATVRVIATIADGAALDRDLARLLDRVRIRVPALAERLEDVAVIASHFAKTHAARVGKTLRGISDASLARLEDYRWPGNVDELESVIERAVIASNSELIEIEESQLDDAISIGSYKLIERIGAGAMGEVWKAKHKLLARPAAIKIIRAETLGDAEMAATAVARFRREAEMTSRLTSPHTVQLHDFGVGADGAFYYVMELLQGMDLERIVDKFGPMPPARVIPIIQQACRSLAEAHGLGLVHRDIKPANLYLACLGGQPEFLKVLDFGLVKADAGGDDTKLTIAGSSGGTPEYIAPEVAMNDAKVDGRADLYSLGCAAFFLLTGKPVFKGTNVMRTIMRHVQETPVAPSTLSPGPLPAALDEVVLACLAKSPGKRPESATELFRRLAAIEIDEPWPEDAAIAWWQEHLPRALDPHRDRATTTPDNFGA